MRQKLRRVFAFILASAMLFSVLACGGNGDEGQGSSNSGEATISDKDTIVRIVPAAEQGNYNPVTVTGTAAMAPVSDAIFEPLIKNRTEGRELRLCESYEWTDPLTCVFHLREDVYSTTAIK